jgi:ABC-type Fe3+-hydroxamate transport system substrate-binding protein
MIGWGRWLCCAVVVLGMTTSQPAQVTGKATYAVIGSEAGGLLPLLVNTRSMITVRVGELADVLSRTSITALIVPEEWSNTVDLQAADAAHLPIIHLKRHNSIAHILANVHTLARLVGEPSAGEHITRRMRAGLAAVRARYATSAPIRVMLLTPEGYTEGQGTLLTEMIAYAGGVNVAAEAGIPEARQIADAQIREFAPEVVLLIHWTAEDARVFAENAAYRGIPAFDQGRIVRIAPLGKHPAALVSDVEQLAVILHR